MWYPFLIIISVQGTFYSPEQVRLSWTDSDTSMSVTWAAEATSIGASVEYTPVSSYNQTVISYTSSSPGIWSTFPNMDYPQILQRHLNVCKAYMTNLTQGGLYAYRVGSEAYGWTQQFVFQAKRDYTQDPVTRMLIFGDMSAGVTNEATLQTLVEEISSNQYDAIIHNGDIAYNLDDDNGRRGDLFMRNVEPLASRMPYLVTQGNHESDGTLLNYMNRFQMPGNASSLWYSFNAGRAHFIGFDTELTYQDDYSYLQPKMMEFMQNDMQEYNRTNYPWLIVFGHKPLYCSADWTPASRSKGLRIDRFGDCTQEAEYLRGIFEDLFYNQKVDLVIGSHVHAYERLGPAYKNQSMTCQVETDTVCIGASAPIYPVTGVPGNDESYDPPSPTPLPFSKAQDGQLGFSRLTVFNDTHLLWEEVRSLTSEVSDTLWLIKGTSEQAQSLDN